MTYTDYINFFRDLMVNHQEVCHIEEKGEATFMCSGWEEIGKFRADMRPKSYAITLLTPDVSYSTDANRNCCKRFDGAIQVTHWHGQRKQEISPKAAMDLALKVVQDIITRVLREASSNESIFEGCKIRSCEDFAKQITPRECIHGGGYSGWLLQFSIPLVDNSLSPDAACNDITDVWKDL